MKRSDVNARCQRVVAVIRFSVLKPSWGDESWNLAAFLRCVLRASFAMLLSDSLQSLNVVRSGLSFYFDGLQLS